MQLKTHTIKDNKSSVSVIPERWWLINSIILDWTELLFMNEETLFDLSKNVRWWIPILFPNAWPADKELFNSKGYNLFQHWFARNKEWSLVFLSENSFKLELLYDDESIRIFPFKFKHEIQCKINDKSIEITQSTYNLWDSTMPVAAWLHPYFRINNASKSDFKIFDVNWVEIESNFDLWSNWLTARIKNPIDFNCFIPWIWKLKFNYSNTYDELWLWSEYWKDFICIEPFERWENWLILNPNYILPWDVSIGKILISKI